MSTLTKSTLNIKYSFDKKGLKRGEYSSQYFLKTKKILDHEETKISTLQFSILDEGKFVLAGISESILLLKKVLPKKIFKSLKIYGRKDGEIINHKTGILYIEGEYKNICLFENIIDGILNKRIGIATRAYELNQLIKPHQTIIYMADRSEDYWSQNGNGLAAYLGGIKFFSTQKNLEYVRQINKDISPIGTMPHALIQQFKGDILKACQAYIKNYPNQKLIALLDYQNDVIGSLEQLKPILNQIYGVRIDTSKNLIDKSLANHPHNAGINSQLITLVKTWLINHNFSHVKIVVSSGIDNHKIKELNTNSNAIDVFGIGNYFLTKRLNITADLISINGENEAKVGRDCLVNYKKELFHYQF